MIELTLREISSLEKKGLIKKAVAKTEYWRNQGILKFFTEEGKEISPELLVKYGSSIYYIDVPLQEFEKELEKHREEVTKKQQQEEERQRMFEEERKKKLLEMWEKVRQLSKGLPKPKKPKEGNEKKFLYWLEKIYRENKEYHELLDKLFANQITLGNMGLNLESLPRYGLTRQYSRPITYGYVYYWDPEVRKYLVIAKVYYDSRGEPGFGTGKLIFQYCDKPHPNPDFQFSL